MHGALKLLIFRARCAWKIEGVSVSRIHVYGTRAHDVKHVLRATPLRGVARKTYCPNLCA